MTKIQCDREFEETMHVEQGILCDMSDKIFNFFQIFYLFFFFFKQKTAYEIKECDWSSDVCSSDLFS